MKTKFLNNRSKNDLLKMAKNLGLDGKNKPMEKLIKLISTFSYETIKKSYNDTKN